MTTVSEAVGARKSVRAFLDTPVSEDLIRDILTKAARAPSGANMQPWFVHVLTGDSLADLKAKMPAELSAHPLGNDPEFSMYPDPPIEPYRTRQIDVAREMYALLGITREDKLGKVQQMARNYLFFDAPVGLFFSIRREMARNQWAHLGMFMQTVALLAVERGLGTCLQEAWSLYPKFIGNYLQLPAERMLYCGMALGYEDREAPVNQLRTNRAKLDEFASFLR